MKHPRHADLTKGSIPQHLLKMSLPMVWGILAIVSMQLADVYFIGQLGHTELAAISFTFPISMAIFSFVMGLSIATSSIIARLVGAGDTDGMKHFLVHAILIATLTGLIIAVIGTPLIDPVFRHLGAGPEHMPHIHAFMTISLWGYMFITIPLVGNSALRATGDSFTPSLIMIGVALINIPLSMTLIFGLHSWHGMGVAGAATANVVSNIISAIACGYVLVYRAHILDRSCLSLAGFGRSAKRLLTIAIPIGITNLIQPLMAAFITALLATSGAAAVAAYGIITRIEAVAAVVLMAVAIGMGPIIGQCFGAGRPDRVRETIRLAMTFALIWSFAVGLFLMACGSIIAREFTNEAQTISIAHTYFLITGCSMALANLTVGWGSVWNALGRPRNSVSLILVRSLIGIMLFGYIGHLMAGWYGVFIGLMIGNLISGLALHFYSASKLERMLKTA